MSDATTTLPPPSPAPGAPPGPAASSSSLSTADFTLLDALASPGADLDRLARERGLTRTQLALWLTLPHVRQALEALDDLHARHHRLFLEDSTREAVTALRTVIRDADDAVERRRAAAAVLRACRAVPPAPCRSGHEAGVPLSRDASRHVNGGSADLHDDPTPPPSVRSVVGMQNLWAPAVTNERALTPPPEAARLDPDALAAFAVDRLREARPPNGWLLLNLLLPYLATPIRLDPRRVEQFLDAVEPLRALLIDPGVTLEAHPAAVSTREAVKRFTLTRHGSAVRFGVTLRPSNRDEAPFGDWWITDIRPDDTS